LICPSSVNRERVAAYLDCLEKTCSPFGLMNRIQVLRHALRVLTPGEEPPWLVSLEKTLRRRAAPAHDKRARLQSPAALIALGETLMVRAETAQHWSLQR
jgi:hypothetical protein